MSDCTYYFNKVFNKITAEIEYNDGWANGTGYLDFAVSGKNAPELYDGQIVKSVDIIGRKIIIIGTRLGNVIVFERYANKGEDAVYVVNRPADYQNFIPSAKVEADTMVMLLGFGVNPLRENFGATMGYLVRQWVEAGN